MVQCKLGEETALRKSDGSAEAVAETDTAETWRKKKITVNTMPQTC